MALGADTSLVDVHRAEPEPDPNPERDPQLAGEQPAPGAQAQQSPPPKRKRDKGPKRRGAKRRPAAPAGEKPKLVGAAAQAADKTLTRELARVLVFPAMPSIMLAPSLESKAFLATHFTETGPSTAEQLVAASRNSPELREILERLTKGSTSLTIAIALIAYAAPPVLWMVGARAQAQGISTAIQLANDIDPDSLAAMMSQLQDAQPAPSPDVPDAAEAAGAAAPAPGASTA